MVFDLSGGKKIDLGLPSFESMMKGKGISLLPTKKGGIITNGIKPIKLGNSFEVQTKRARPASAKKQNNPVGLGEGLKTEKKKVFRIDNVPQIVLPKAKQFRVGKLDQNVRPTAELIRKQAFDQLDRNRGQGLQQEGTGKEITTDADKFAFGIQNKPVRDASVISNRKFQFVTLQDGVLQKKEFRDKELAEGQRRLAEAQGNFEQVSQVREIRI